MPRHKPTSTKAKKADQQLRRAIKRGDVPAPDPTKKPPRKPKGKVGPTGNRIGAAASEANIESMKRLQSAFVKVSAEFLEETKVLASNLPLTRPIPKDSTSLPPEFSNDSTQPQLSCPRRPKWRFDMTKVEVESNEEGLFKKWLTESDRLVDGWRTRLDGKRKSDADPQGSMPPSITHFERNLEVWRQLWRVTEISQLLLVLLDSRCPELHYPPALSAYLEKKKIILVLTKVDISGPARVDAWKAFLRAKHPELPIVEVESYIEKDATAVHQGRRQLEPSIPTVFREKLIDAIRQVHSELLAIPDQVQNDPARLKAWIPAIKQDIDWKALLEARGDLVGLRVSNPDVPQLDENHDGDDEAPSSPGRKEPEFLTIGLIGQPNVGKSSLLNALFGARRVRASKTPGKTKHFQTLFWTPDVRLVDCPGLIIPSFVPMEMQVLTGVLPISRVSAVPSCVYFAAQLLPLERVLRLQHPSLSETPQEDKRSWRGPRPQSGKGEIALKWAATDILTAYANSKGWVTAKAGRPDVHRAGNAVLRSLAEGRVHWAFWPPGHEPPDSDDLGIWIPHMDIIESEDEDGHTPSDGPSDDTSESEEEVDDDVVRRNVGIGRFGALALADDDESESSEE